MTCAGAHTHLRSLQCGRPQRPGRHTAARPRPGSLGRSRRCTGRARPGLQGHGGGGQWVGLSLQAEWAEESVTSCEGVQASRCKVAPASLLPLLQGGHPARPCSPAALRPGHPPPGSMRATCAACSATHSTSRDRLRAAPGVALQPPPPPPAFFLPLLLPALLLVLGCACWPLLLACRASWPSCRAGARYRQRTCCCEAQVRR